MNKVIKGFFIILFVSYYPYLSVFADDKNKPSSLKSSVKHGEFKGAKDATHPEWFKESFLDLEEDIDEATENNKRLVIYFWQPGCPYCDQLWSDNLAQQEVVDNFRKNFDIVALNMWGDREIVNVNGNTYTEKSFAEALGIKYTPTLLFFDENKKVIHQLNGYVPVDNFQKTMMYVSAKKEKVMSFSEFSMPRAESSSIASSATLNKQDFFELPMFDLDRRDEENTNTKFTAVFFEAKNCKNCDLLHQKTLKDETTLALAKQFIAVQLDRFSDNKVITPNGKTTTAKQWATELGIEYLPAIHFFDKAGKQVMRIDTQLRTFHIQSIFDYVLSGTYATEPNFQRYISARADKIRETGKDVDIFAY